MKKISIKSEGARLSKILVFTLTVALTVLLFSCGEKKTTEYTVLKNNKVEGPVDAAMAEKGAQVFKEKCTACHKLNEKYVGPPLGTVAKRRSADYILSQIMHPEQMIANNDTVKALMAIYPTPMANQHLTFDQARSVLEYFRQVAENGGK